MDAVCVVTADHVLLSTDFVQNKDKHMEVLSKKPLQLPTLLWSKLTI